MPHWHEIITCNYRDYICIRTTTVISRIRFVSFRLFYFLYSRVLVWFLHLIITRIAPLPPATECHCCRRALAIPCSRRWRSQTRLTSEVELTKEVWPTVSSMIVLPGTIALFLLADEPVFLPRKMLSACSESECNSTVMYRTLSGQLSAEHVDIDSLISPPPLFIPARSLSVFSSR